jgi:hypothetical protein
MTASGGGMAYTYDDLEAMTLVQLRDVFGARCTR